MVGLGAARLQTGNAALAARARPPRTRPPPPARLAKVENQLDRFRAEEFRNCVMREVAELLVKGGPLTPAEILPELRAVKLRGATLHREPPHGGHA